MTGAAVVVVVVVLVVEDRPFLFFSHFFLTLTRSWLHLILYKNEPRYGRLQTSFT